jgi:hypothetical protein
VAWVFRVVWVAVPFLAGPAFAEALSGRSGAVQTVASLGLWTGFVGVLGASLVLRAPSLTAVRVSVPAGLAVAGWAASQDGVDDATGALAVTALIVAAVLAFLPRFGDVFVDGSSYGPERRFTLRVPTPLVLGPIPLAWVVAVAGTVTGPLLLAAEQWVAGPVALVVGVPLAVAAVRSLHTLARRWVVFVPGGLVLHDPLTVAESVLMPRAMLADLGTAPADASGLDLSLGALGLVLRARLRESLAVSLNRPLTRTVESVEADAVLFCPRRRRAVLEAAAERRIAVVGG